MSRTCGISTCKFISRAVCHCCQQELCIDHLKDHHDLLNAQLLPLVDEINTIGDRLTSTTSGNSMQHAHEKLQQWKFDCYQLIEQIFQEKLRETDRHFRMQIVQVGDEVNRTRLKLLELIHQQQATSDDIHHLTLEINQLKEKLRQVERIPFDLNIQPLQIDEPSIEPVNFSALSLPSRTVDYQDDYSSELASNDRYLLIRKDASLCLIDQRLNIIKQLPWKFQPIINICWSSTLARFILITSSGNVFCLDPENMSPELLLTISNDKLWSCTCSDNALYLSLDEPGSAILQYCFSPSIEFLRKWKSPDTCADEEFIYDISSDNQFLLVMIANGLKRTIRLDLKSTDNFECLRSLPLDIQFQSHSFRCCLFNSNEWLISDWCGSRLLHVTRELRVKTIQMYHKKPWRLCVFNRNMLVIATKNSFNFHMLTSRN